MIKGSSSPSSWVKTSTTAPSGFFATEAAGLRWLAETRTVPVVTVLDVSADALTLERLESTPPTLQAAFLLGTQLADLHSCPAPTFGALPPGAEAYFFGPLDSPLLLPTGHTPHFGVFYADTRLSPLIERCERDGVLGRDEGTLVKAICDALRVRDPALDGAAVRIHGDLWSGNLMWTPQGATVIDPAACGGHPLADLAMLEMFGAPYLEEMVAGYTSHRPLASDWRDSLGLHQLFGYLVHLHLFGPTYAASTRAAARSAAHYLGV